MNTHLAHEAGPVAVDGLGADAEMLADLCVRHAPRDASENLDLPCGEALRYVQARHGRLGVTRKNLGTGRNAAQCIAQVLRRTVLEKDAICAGIRKLPENPGRGVAGHDHDPRLRRPTPRFDQDFEARGTRHGQVKDSEMRAQPANVSDRLDAIGGGSDNLEFDHVTNCTFGAPNCQIMIVGNKDSVSQTSKSGSSCRHSLSSILSFVAIQVFCFLFTYTSIAAEATRIVKLSGPVSAVTLAQHVEYRLDPDWKLAVEDVTSGSVPGSFQPIDGKSADFGYTRSAIWLRFTASNETSDTDDWKLFFRENFMQVFEVYQESPEHGIRTLIAQDQHSPFSSRPHPYPELVVPFSLQPGEQTRFYIRYWSGGSSELSFSIETAMSFDAFSTRRSAKNFIYYGMMLFLSALALVALLATRNTVFLAYAGYSGSALLFIMHADGNGFKYLWPDSPVFNGFATVVFGAGIVIFGALFAQIFLQTKRFHPVIDKLLLATVILTLGLILGALFGDTQTMKKVLVLMAFAGILLFTLAGLVAARKRFREVRFYVLAWAGALVSSSIMTGRHWLGIDISEEMQYDSIRIVMVSDATFMGMAIWDRINQLRKASHAALRQSLFHAERNLTISRRMQELEKQYAMALNLVADKDRMLADTVHDLRQPLHALRLNVQRLISGDAAARAKPQDIEQAFTYLEALVADQLEQGGCHGTRGFAGGEADRAGRRLSVNDVLASVHEMFLPDARAKGLRFVHVPTSLESSVEPLVLMRMVSNLVANAINYTDAGKILLGCRRSAAGIRVEVHDTGTGMTPDEWEAALQRNVRLENTAGQTAGNGLGLAIVSQLATRHGLSIRLDEKRREGTGIIVKIPFGQGHETCGSG